MKNLSVCLATLHSSYSHSAVALYALQRSLQKNNTNLKITFVEELLTTPFTDIVHRLTEQSFDVFAFSCYIWNREEILHLASVLKKIFPHCIIVLGGPEIQGEGIFLLKKHSYIDYILSGEGEISFSWLLKFLQGDKKILLSKISGLQYREIENQKINYKKNFLKRLESHQIESVLPLSLAELQNKNIVYWETSRGCPFGCSFCSSGRDKMRHRSLEILEKELSWLSKTQKPLTIKLLDRSFSLAKNREQLLKLFLDSSKYLRFHLEANPDYLDEIFFEMIEKFERHRLQFELGLQSLQKDVLKAVHRKMNIEKAFKNSLRLIEMGFDVHIDLLAGLPQQSFTSFEQDIDKTFLLFVDHLQLGTLKLLPGSELWENQNHILADEHPPYEVFATDTMPQEDLKLARSYAKLVERIYNSNLLRYSLFYLAKKLPNELPNQQGISFVLKIFAQEKQGIFVYRLWQKQELFVKLAEILLKEFSDDFLLKEILIWDYMANFLANEKAPNFVKESIFNRRKISEQEWLVLEKNHFFEHPFSFQIWKNQHNLKSLLLQKSFPLFYFSEEAIDFFKNIPGQKFSFLKEEGNYFCLRRSGDKQAVPLWLKEI